MQGDRRNVTITNRTISSELWDKKDGTLNRTRGMFWGNIRAQKIRMKRARGQRKRTRGWPTWERRSLPYHSEIDARNNTFRIQHPSFAARCGGAPRRGARRLRPGIDPSTCGGHAVAVAVAVAVDDGIAAQPRATSARLRLAFRSRHVRHAVVLPSLSLSLSTLTPFPPLPPLDHSLPNHRNHRAGLSRFSCHSSMITESGMILSDRDFRRKGER